MKILKNYSLDIYLRKTYSNGALGFSFPSLFFFLKHCFHLQQYKIHLKTLSLLENYTYFKYINLLLNGYFVVGNYTIVSFYYYYFSTNYHKILIIRGIKTLYCTKFYKTLHVVSGLLAWFPFLSRNYEFRFELLLNKEMSEIK